MERHSEKGIKHGNAKIGKITFFPVYLKFILWGPNDIQLVGPRDVDLSTLSKIQVKLYSWTLKSAVLHMWIQTIMDSVCVCVCVYVLVILYNVCIGNNIWVEVDTHSPNPCCLRINCSQISWDLPMLMLEAFLKAVRIWMIVSKLYRSFRYQGLQAWLVQTSAPHLNKCSNWCQILWFKIYP